VARDRDPSTRRLLLAISFGFLWHFACLTVFYVVAVVTLGLSRDQAALLLAFSLTIVVCAPANRCVWAPPAINDC